MPSTRKRIGVAAAALLMIGASALIPAKAAQGGGPTAFVLGADNTLTRVDVRAPSGILAAATAIAGLQAGESVLGIDFRPATGELYGLGSTSRLYKINTVTGAATQVGTGPFATPLAGTRFGFDFNPTVDRIRVVSDAGQNLRLHPVTGAVAVVDTNLAYSGTAPNAGSEPTKAITAAAYTNNSRSATATTLFDIDTGNDRLITQIPPNSGTLNTVGPLGVAATAVNGFDILSFTNPTGTAGTNTAYAALQKEGETGSGLYSVNLATGAAALIGNLSVAGARGLAIAPNGYWLAAADGGVFAYGDAKFFGGMGAIALAEDIVGIESTATGLGYWMVAADGGVFAFGDAGYVGSLPQLGVVPDEPVVDISATPSGKGYFLLGADGGVFNFGDAKFPGSAAGFNRNGVALGIRAVSDDSVFIASTDGGVFALGDDAAFQGSAGALKLNSPVIDLATTPSGKGYWLAAADGGIFAYGDARFFGSQGGNRLNFPVLGIDSSPSGNGYYLGAIDGGVFAHGDAGFAGASNDINLVAPVVDIARAKR